MTNSVGQVVHFWNTSGNDRNFRLQTADLQAGVYFVTVNMGNRYYTRKLIK
jgi:hypothetical protein